MKGIPDTARLTNGSKVYEYTRHDSNVIESEDTYKTHYEFDKPELANAFMEKAMRKLVREGYSMTRQNPTRRNIRKKTSLGIETPEKAVWAFVSRLHSKWDDPSYTFFENDLDLFTWLKENYKEDAFELYSLGKYDEKPKGDDEYDSFYSGQHENTNMLAFFKALDKALWDDPLTDDRTWNGPKLYLMKIDLQQGQGFRVKDDSGRAIVRSDGPYEAEDVDHTMNYMMFATFLEEYLGYPQTIQNPTRRNIRKKAIMPITVKYLNKEITCDQCGNTDLGGHRGAGLGYTGKRKMGTICADCKYQFENDGMILPHGEMAKVMFIETRKNGKGCGCGGKTRRNGKGCGCGGKARRNPAMDAFDLYYILDGRGGDYTTYFRNWDLDTKTVEAAEDKDGPYYTYDLTEYDMMNSADVLAYRGKIDITDIAEVWRGKAYTKDTSMRSNPSNFDAKIRESIVEHTPTKPDPRPNFWEDIGGYKKHLGTIAGVVDVYVAFGENTTEYDRRGFEVGAGLPYTGDEYPWSTKSFNVNYEEGKGWETYEYITNEMGRMYEEWAKSMNLPIISYYVGDHDLIILGSPEELQDDDWKKYMALTNCDHSNYKQKVADVEGDQFLLTLECSDCSKIASGQTAIQWTRRNPMPECTYCGEIDTVVCPTCTDFEQGKVCVVCCRMHDAHEKSHPPHCKNCGGDPCHCTHRNPRKNAKSDAPDYRYFGVRPVVNAEFKNFAKCGNCKWWDAYGDGKGHCKAFDFTCQDEFLCDGHPDIVDLINNGEWISGEGYTETEQQDLARVMFDSTHDHERARKAIEARNFWAGAFDTPEFLERRK